MVIAFFLMAAIGGVAFGIGRIFVMDSAISNLYESGALAYYAAESGIEEGMLRYRYNQDYELPLADTSKVKRFDLTAGSNLAGNPYDPNTLVTNHAKKYYDLNVVNKAEFYAEDTNGDGTFNTTDFYAGGYGGAGTPFRISRDEAVKIDVSDIIGSGADLKIYIAMRNFTGGFNNSNSFIEAKVTGHKDPKFPKEFKKALVTAGNDNFEQSTTVTIDDTGRVDHFVRNNILNAIAGSVLNDAEHKELFLKPIGCDIDIALVPVNATEMSSPWTTVKSIGYYGDATRTLTAKIDRQSGTVYDLFDFVVYRHN